MIFASDTPSASRASRQLSWRRPRVTVAPSEDGAHSGIEASDYYAAMRDLGLTPFFGFGAFAKPKYRISQIVDLFTDRRADPRYFSIL